MAFATHAHFQAAHGVSAPSTHVHDFLQEVAYHRAPGIPSDAPTIEPSTSKCNSMSIPTFFPTNHLAVGRPRPLPALPPLPPLAPRPPTFLHP